MLKKERYLRIIEWFQSNIPVAETELHYETPFQLLVSVILSAQCTDKRINMVTPELFRHFPTPEAMASTTFEELFPLVRSVSYPNNKAKHLIGMAQKLLSNFNGVVPQDIEQLQTLPGVGRKTANVIAAVVFHLPAMPVDTHVFRVANRIGLTTNSKNPLQTEKELVRFIPGKLLPIAHHWLILHGRYVCTARNPHCITCGISEWCKSAPKEDSEPKQEEISPLFS